MDYIHFFETNDAFESAYDYSSELYSEPWVSYTNETKRCDVNIEPSVKFICEDGTVLKSYGYDIEGYSGVITDQLLFNAVYDNVAPQIGFPNFRELNRFLQYWKSDERSSTDPSTNDNLEKFINDVQSFFNRDISMPTAGEVMEKFEQDVLEVNPFSMVSSNIVTVQFGKDVTVIDGGTELDSIQAKNYIFTGAKSINKSVFSNVSGKLFIASYTNEAPSLSGSAAMTTDMLVAVRNDAVAGYKVSAGWSQYADKIFGVL